MAQRFNPFDLRSEAQIRAEAKRARRIPYRGMAAGLLALVVAGKCSEIMPLSQEKGGLGDLENLILQGQVRFSFYDPTQPTAVFDPFRYSPQGLDAQLRAFEQGKAVVVKLLSPDGDLWCLPTFDPNVLAAFLRKTSTAVHTSPRPPSPVQGAESFRAFCTQHHKRIYHLSQVAQPLAHLAEQLPAPATAILTRGLEHDPFVLAGISRI